MWEEEQLNQVMEENLFRAQILPVALPPIPSLRAALRHIPRSRLRNLISFDTQDRNEPDFFLLLPQVSRTWDQTHPPSISDSTSPPGDGGRDASTHLPAGKHKHQPRAGRRQPPRQEGSQHRLEHGPMPRDHADLGEMRHVRRSTCCLKTENNPQIRPRLMGKHSKPLLPKGDRVSLTTLPASLL